MDVAIIIALKAIEEYANNLIDSLPVCQTQEDFYNLIVETAKKMKEDMQ